MFLLRVRLGLSMCVCAACVRACVRACVMMCDDVFSVVGCVWLFRHDRQTAPKFGTHVRIDTLTLKKN